MVNEKVEEPIRDRILETLRDHPLFSRRQLELYLGCPLRTARQGLEELVRRGWAQRYNARQPWMHSRSLFAPTAEGVRELARRAGAAESDYVEQAGLSSARLEHLLVMMERVFQLRTLLLWLARPEGRWQAQVWDVEVARFFGAKNRGFWIPFHGAALMRRLPAQENRWASIVVEFDLRRIPVEGERERLVRFVTAQDDPRFWGQEKEQQFPIFVVIAQDEFRLQDYYNLLRSAALARQLPMPHAYFTTFDTMLTLRGDNTRPIWYSTISGRRVSLLFDTEGVSGPLPEQVPWRRMPLRSKGAREQRESERVGKGERGRIVSHSPALPLSPAPQPLAPVPADGPLAALALALGPLEKRLLDEIAAHPLLTAKDLAVLLQASLWRVSSGLAQLKLNNLVEIPRQGVCSTTDVRGNRGQERYLVTEKGQRYLAMVAGFGNAVRRFARARGWGKGFESLVRRWEHTRAGNEVFLHLAEIARRRGHIFTWLSELESRLYYELGGRRHSFLPDGRGTYIAGDRRYEFALEIDRSRMAQEKLRRKFAEYSACVGSNILRGEGVELLRMLVVTTSWERAEGLRRAALEFASADMPVFITTFGRLRASGADAAIWLRVETSQLGTDVSTAKTYCFDCFIPKSKPLRQSLPTTCVS